MSTDANKIRRWLVAGKRKRATHVIVVCDTFDHTDTPVYVAPGQDARAVSDAESRKPMQRVMEVYNLAMDIDAQLKEYRAFNY